MKRVGVPRTSAEASPVSTSLRMRRLTSGPTRSWSKRATSRSSSSAYCRSSAWSTASSSDARTGRRASGMSAPGISDANGLSDEDDVDAAGVLLVDLENLSDLAVLAVGGVRPCIREGETVLDDPLTGLLRAGD